MHAADVASGAKHRQRFPDRLVTCLFVAAVAFVDFGPFKVYRYFLVSDALLLAALGLQLARQWDLTLYYPKFILFLFAAYLVSTGVAFLRPVAPVLGLSTWIHWAFLMMAYVPTVTTLLVVRPDLRTYVMPTVLASATLQAFVVVAAVAGGLNWSTGPRIAGALGSIQLWTYACAVVVVAAWVMTGSWRMTLVAMLSLLPLAATEMFLRSRMLWVASVLGASIFAVVQAKRKGAAVLAGVAACAALAAAYELELYPDAVQDRIAVTLRPTETADLVARLQVVSDVTAQVIDSPLIGLGVAQSPEYLQGLPVPPLIVDAHNIILHAASEGGLVAAAAIAMLPFGIAVLWAAALRNRLEAVDRVRLNWCGASLLALFVAAQLTPTLYEHTFYFLIGFLASLAVPPEASTSPRS